MLDLDLSDMKNLEVKRLRGRTFIEVTMQNGTKVSILLNPHDAEYLKEQL